jgi:hypothetical protein
MKGCMIRVLAILVIFFFAAYVRAEDSMSSELPEPSFSQVEPPPDLALVELPKQKVIVPPLSTADSPATTETSTPSSRQVPPPAMPETPISSAGSDVAEEAVTSSATSFMGRTSVPQISIDVPTLSKPSDMQYQVIPNGNNLELVTPYGRRILFGDRGLKDARGYRIEIPLSELRPPEKAKPDSDLSEEKLRELLKEKDRREQEEKDRAEKESAARKRDLASQRMIVEYDDTDRLILEANRLYNRGKYYEASLTVEEILSKKPELPRAWVMKGSLMFVQGQKDLAKNAWQKALELDPANSQVKAYLGRLK